MLDLHLNAGLTQSFFHPSSFPSPRRKHCSFSFKITLSAYPPDLISYILFNYRSPFSCIFSLLPAWATCALII